MLPSRATGHPPLQAHAGECCAAGKRRRAVDRDGARRLLASGLPAFHLTETGCIRFTGELGSHRFSYAIRWPGRGPAA
ncbi:hypothetical protein FPZ41_35940 [Streptomyces sp. K1PN6]|uniref:Uncharacterized protein n=2 Tax=Streptomyces acidicola TaxID=2596892 RepID=A0A5N8X2A2_9ACTN|nr:hypothetical protein [Streptomyces acidicola]